MKTLTNFRYGESQKISHWGHGFDSLTELKFALSIRDDYEFLRACISIYYHPGTKQSTDVISTCHHRYTPDFLMRHKETGEAFLVEIKPRAFENHPQLDLRKEVAENYIRCKKYDWTFKIIFDDEIILSEEQLADFEEYRQLKSRSARKIWFEQYPQNLVRCTSASLFNTLTGNKKIAFLLLGNQQNHTTQEQNPLSL
jgi:hypothetical protein